MAIFSLLLSDAFAPFTAALATVLVLFVVEVLLTVMVGLGCSDFIDSLISPDSLPDTTFINWLLLREIPLSLVLVAFLTTFGLSGYVVQIVAQVISEPLPHYLSVFAAICLGLFGLRGMAGLISRFNLVGSTALPVEAFIGQEVTLSSPTASKGHAGAATFRDSHGQTHQVMVEPMNETETFTQGERLILNSRASLSMYLAKKV